MKRLALLLLCASLFLCACARTQPEETTAQTPLTETTTEQTTVQTTTVQTTALTTTMLTTTDQTTATTEETTTVATETTYVEALGETKIKLSTMSEEDCRKFLAEAGVEVPPHLNGIRTRGVISMFEDNPDRSVVFGSRIAEEFWESVRNIVREYYGLPKYEKIEY